MPTISININRAKLTAAAWQGFLRMHPLPAEDPPETGTEAQKLAYITSVVRQQLAFTVRRGMQLNEREAAETTPPDFDVTE